jgi:hypothetical protein
VRTIEKSRLCILAAYALLVDHRSRFAMSRYSRFLALLASTVFIAFEQCWRGGNPYWEIFVTCDIKDRARNLTSLRSQIDQLIRQRAPLSIMIAFRLHLGGRQG